MKIFSNIFVFCFSVSTFAAVDFQFTYDDDFDSENIRHTIEQAGKILGGWLDHDATIHIQVNVARDFHGIAGCSSQFRKSSFLNPVLLEDGSIVQMEFYESELKPVVMHKIQKGIDLNGNEADGIMYVNTAAPNFFQPCDGEGKLGQEDMLATILHELTHSLGVSSAFYFIGQEKPEVFYSEFDKHIVDAKGRSLVEDFIKPLRRGERVGFSSRLYFSGKHSNEANGGLPVPLSQDLSHVYSLELGNSCEKLENCVISGQIVVNTLMQQPTRWCEQLPRGWGAIDKAILTDLGYSLRE